MKRLIAILAGTSLVLVGNLFPAQGSTAQTDLSGSESTISARMHTACVVTDLGSVRCWGKNQVQYNQIPPNMGRVIQVSVGDEHVCSLNEDGLTKCWGNISLSQTNVPSDLGQVTQISSGGVHTCAITTAGNIRCWGYSGEGRTLAPAIKVTQLSSGNSHSCAVTELGKAVCWGSKEYGASTVPPNLGHVSRVEAGDRYSCAITDEGELKCWGWDWYGSVPSGLGKVKAVEVHSLHVCAIKTNGELKCWTADGWDTKVPKTLGEVTQVADGLEFTCAVTAMNRVRCWGDSQYEKNIAPGQSGRAIQVSLGFAHTCVLTELQLVRCWGENDIGQTNVPSQATGVQSISAGQVSSCLMTNSSEVLCWGNDTFGQTSVPSGLDNVVMMDTGAYNACTISSIGILTCWGLENYINWIPEDLGPVEQVSLGVSHACAILESGSVRCWGRSVEGQTSIPESLGEVRQIEAGGYHTCALMVSSEVQCWGSYPWWSEAFGYSNVPTDLGSVSKISAGDAYTCALIEGGSVRCWGRSVEGQTSIPESLGEVLQIEAGGVHTCALTVSYSLECWGSKEYGASTVPIDVGDQIRVLPLTPDLPTSATPLIEGLPIVGAALSIDEPDWSADTLYRYTWYRDKVEIVGAGSRTHKLVEEDFGKEVSVAVRGFKSGYKSMVRFSPAVTVSKVQIQGLASLGETLLVDAGLWADNNEYTYQWLINNLPIPNANKQEYKLGFEDLGQSVSVKVSGFRNSEFLSNLESNALQVSLEVNNTSCRASVDTSGWKDSKQTTPMITGKPLFGETLTGFIGTWSAASTCSYWLRDGRAVLGSDSPTYKIQPQDIGRQLQYVVVGNDKSGNSFLRYSEPSAIQNGVISSATAPVVTGGMKVGSSVAGSIRSWGSGMTYSYQWLRNGQEIPNAINSKYLLTEGDLGKKIAFRACGSRMYFDSKCLTTSSKTTVSLGVLPSQPKSLILAKSLKVGSTLTGKTGKWASGVSLQSQWLSNGKPIKGTENTATYRLKPSDKGKLIAFRITARKLGYQPAVMTSPTKKIT